MAHYKNKGGIDCFEPDNTEDTLYVEADNTISFDFLIEIGCEYFDCDLEDLEIHSEYIHTRCVYFDRYDPQDYNCFFVISKK
jgi:hypothetical protein